MIEIELSEEAFEDIENARHYYNSQQSELGDDFVDEVQACLDRISEFPQAYSLIDPPNVRRAQLHRFNAYSIIYKLASKNKILVGSVFCWRQDPNDLATRLSQL